MKAVLHMLYLALFGTVLSSSLHARKIIFENATNTNITIVLTYRLTNESHESKPLISQYPVSAQETISATILPTNHPIAITIIGHDDIPMFIPTDSSCNTVVIANDTNGILEIYFQHTDGTAIIPEQTSEQSTTRALTPPCRERKTPEWACIDSWHDDDKEATTDSDSTVSQQDVLLLSEDDDS